MRVGDEDILVLSVPLARSSGIRKGTTSAEQEIIGLVLQGLTAKEIADGAWCFVSNGHDPAWNHLSARPA